MLNVHSTTGGICAFTGHRRGTANAPSKAAVQARRDREAYEASVKRAARKARKHGKQSRT